MVASNHGGKRSGAGRPKIGVKRFSVTIPQKVADEIEQYCNSAQCSRSQFIHAVVESWLVQNGFMKPSD